MKTRLFLLMAVTAWLAGRPLDASADEWGHWTCYSPSGTPRAIPYPSPTCQLNSLLPENNGGYVALWDDVTNRVVVLERQSPERVQIWAHGYVLETNENSRVILGSSTRILYGSAQRWVLLDRDTGTNVATAEWDQPHLDPNKIIIADNILHIVNGGVASRYDTNMNEYPSVEARPPQGFWASYAGTWLIDLGNRTNHSVRVALISDLVQRDIPLPAPYAGGYADHRVLSADSTRLFVMSSINWPTNIIHYFTLIDRSGVLFQKSMACMEIFTGVTALNDGWMISARSVGRTTPRHYLFSVNPDGEISAQLRIDPSTPYHYVALNTDPPRLLHIMAGGAMEISEVASLPWWSWWSAGKTYIDPDVETLYDSMVNAPVGGTNNFWITPICPSPK